MKKIKITIIRRSEEDKRQTNRQKHRENVFERHRQRRRSQSNSETSEHRKEAGFDPGKDGKALRGTKHKPAPPDALLLPKRR